MIDDAFQRVVAFARCFGEPHVTLAMHAALPISLSRELVHLIRIKFTAAPLSAEDDLLLSPLCRDVGGDLYEMDRDVRELLVEELKSEPAFGQSRVIKVAEFVLAYAERGLNAINQPDEILDFLRTQQWAVLAYARPEDAAQSLAFALRERLESANRDETRRCTTVE